MITPAAAAAPGGTARAHAASTPARSRQTLVHELRVHQVELEQQNEELRAAQRDLAQAHERYVDLFDFAPVGYVTVDREGRIGEANLTAADELGVARDTMLGSPFQRFIAVADRDRWQRLMAGALRRNQARSTELRLLRHDGGEFHARLDCLRVRRPGVKAQLRVTITDVSQRKLAETNRRIALSGSLARESERRRVAYALHEDLGQRLVAMKIVLASLATPAAPPSLRSAVQSMTTQIDEAVAVVRHMSSELHPLILDNLGLSAALEWLASRVASRLDLVVELHLDDEPPLDPASAIAVYRLVETVLDEVPQHHCSGISVGLLQRPHDLVLQVQCELAPARSGAPASAAEPSESLRDRVHLLGGRLEVDEPAPDIRRISIFLPIAG